MHLEKLSFKQRDIIELNIGGSTLYTLSRQLLRSVPGSLLDKLFSDTKEPTRIDGRVFLDRDPKIFKLIIRYLRTKKHPNVCGCMKDDYIEELKYFGLFQRSKAHIDMKKIFDRQPQYLTPQ